MTTSTPKAMKVREVAIRFLVEGGSRQDRSRSWSSMCQQRAQSRHPLKIARNSERARVSFVRTCALPQHDHGEVDRWPSSSQS